MSTTTTTTTTADIADAEALEVDAFLGQVAGDAATAFHAATVVLGDKLGLYRALAHDGPATPGELAERTGCDERYLVEWGRAQVAAGYCGFDAPTGRLSLSAAQATVLADDASPAFGASLLALAAVLFKDEERLLRQAVRTGTGVPWHDHHDDLFPCTERLFRPGYVANLVDAWIPALDGVGERLAAGARVADVGCGHGASTIVMAQRYPASTFVGIDSHAGSIEVARSRAQEAGVADRVRFEVARAQDLSGGPFDLVCTFDALHDMGDPVGAAASVARALAADGTFLIVEPMAGDSLLDNRTPIGKLFYAAGLFLCVPHARSEGGPHELGPLVPDGTWAELLGQAGFTRFRRAAETPFNRVFEARR